MKKKKEKKKKEKKKKTDESERDAAADDDGDDDDDDIVRWRWLRGLSTTSTFFLPLLSVALFLSFFPKNKF